VTLPGDDTTLFIYGGALGSVFSPGDFRHTYLGVLVYPSGKTFYGSVSFYVEKLALLVCNNLKEAFNFMKMGLPKGSMM